MPRYTQLGKLPQQRHIQFRKPDGSLYYEELFSTYGFSGPLALLYHLNLPTRVDSFEDLGNVEPKLLTDEIMHHRHLKSTELEPYGNFLTGRVPLIGNQDVIWYQAKVAEQMPENQFFKNSMGDEVLFIHDGTGVLRTQFGNVDIQKGDYLVIPRGTIYRIDFDQLPVRMIAFETRGAVEIPNRYTNNLGQLLEDAPYHERDFRPPTELETHDEKGKFDVLIKIHGRIAKYTYDYHPFDVVGWDGYVFPYAFSIHAFCPITGKLHMPPPIHQTFACKNFVICSFCPRMLDFHPDAVPIPYVHSNVDSDEVLYYCNEKFGSRKGIKEGSITLHPIGIPHGPQPGVTEGALGATFTEELAVMMDTFHPLYLTEEALRIEDPDYWKSWQAPGVTA